MSKVIKQMQMDDLKGTFKGVRDMVMLNVVGLDAITNNQLRLALRKKGIRMQVVKNTLARKVFGDFGFKVEKAWAGATTVAWGGSSIADLSKELQDIVKKHEKFIKVKTALADGQEVTFDLALKMPTRAQAIGRVVSLALAPAARIAGALRGAGGTVASQIKTLSERKEEAAAPEAVPETAPA
jgi:large subunit ribosomal protein L10